MAPPRSGNWQRHHLLPRALLLRGQIGRFVRGLAICGFHLEDRASNLIVLPGDEDTAAVAGAAMHRGPHPHYSAVVIARVERVRALHQRERIGAVQAARRLARLQRALCAILSGHAPRLILLNRRDPMRLFADYGALDAAIDAGLAAEAQRRRIAPDSSS
jgi:hypothetical protein